MEMNETASLTAVEHLFEEFFNPYTSNCRKQEIEVQLTAFRNTPHVWRICLYFLSHTSSQYVSMFALQALESVITQRWQHLDWSSQEEIKSVLQNNLICQGHSIPHFLQNKFAKLLVDIAKHDWPNKYPDFFDSILRLLKSEEWNQMIGLLLLRTTCEEFMGNNSNFHSLDRKRETTRLLHNYIPVVFEVLTGIIEKLSTRPLHNSTATPPPSPTHPSSNPNFAKDLTTAAFKPDHKELTQEALNTVQLMFAWVPIGYIPSRIVTAIFAFTNVSTYAQDDDDVCVCAMSTINEILYRKCVPPGSDNFFKEIYNHTVELLRSVTSSGSQSLEKCDEEFVKKLCELIVLILEQHLSRFEKDPNFSPLEFLSLLFQFTMQLSSMQCYLRSLNVWTAFFKQINQENAQSYSEVFMGLGTALLKKIQFTYNCEQLSQLNSTEVDEDNKTEWQIFLGATVDVISRAAQYSPVAIFNQALNMWNVSNSVYRQLESAVDHQNYSINIDSSETQRLYFLLQDYVTLSHNLASLAHHFYLNDDEAINRTMTPTIFMLIDNILQSASLAKTIRFYNLKVQDSKLPQCFIDIHSELLASLKTWLSWMDSKNQVSSNMSIFLEMILPLLQDGNNVPTKINNSAAHLLLELSRKPYSLNPMTHPAIAHFIQQVPNLKFNDKDTRDTINTIVCELLLKQLKANEIEEFNMKSEFLNNFIVSITKDFRELASKTPEDHVQVVVDNILPSLSHVIEYCRGFSIVAKKELTSALKPTLDHSLVLFPDYVRYEEVHSNFAKFFISVLKNLHSQIGVEYTKHAIHVFLQVAVSEQRSNNLSGLQQLLDIFCVVVRESSNKTFLPDILQLCMESIYPLLLSHINDSPDVFAAFLDLLYSILNYRWLYFYNSQVMLGYSPGGSDSELGPDVPKRPEQLVAILEVFGQALLQDDINIFRRSLFILQDLNHNKKLYHKALFRTHFLSELLKVLLNTLLYKRQGLSCEDIIFGIYSLAEVDFDGFFSTFLPHFVHSLDGINPQKYEVLMRNFDPTNDKDVPSFLQHLQNFATEFHNLQVCNM